MLEHETVAVKSIDDLTSRLRHPARWTLRHPLRAAQRQKLAATVTLVGVLAACLAIQRRRDLHGSA